MKKVLLKLVTCIMCVFFLSTPVISRASDTAIPFSQESEALSGSVMTLSKDAIAYTDPDDKSGEKMSFAKGETVFVLEKTDGWCKVFYKGEKLYIPEKCFSSETIEETNDVATELASDVTQELREAQKRDAADIEAYERQRISRQNAIIWKMVIVVLVVMIIFLSIFVGVSNMKSDRENT